jgi:hypothetical protein
MPAHLQFQASKNDAKASAEAKSLAGGDYAQGQGQRCLALPLYAEVGNKFEIAPLVDKPTLVDKYATIILATLDSLGNLGK